MRPRRTLKNQPEEACAVWLESHGFTVSKRGWPDFVVFDSHGRLAAVEVKRHAHHRLRHTQYAVMRALAHGGFPVFLWTPEGGLSEVIHRAREGVGGGFLAFSSDRVLSCFQ
jgi:hypothetical protein